MKRYEEKLTYTIQSMERLNADTWSMVVACPEIAEQAEPGQFVHLLPKGEFTLRRPISICEIHRNESIRLVFAVRGKGTAALSALRQGDTVNMLAPLGHGFTLVPPEKHVLLIGGGIGTPPMLPLAQKYGANATVICGFRNADSIILQEDFSATGAEVLLCTDDGSVGISGQVTIPLKEKLHSDSVACIYACGPLRMLEAVAQCAKTAGVPCEVSLEERMGCGIGACLVCACKVTAADGTEQYLHVCKDGPVFRAEEVFGNG